jgi:hypothetical protein
MGRKSQWSNSTVLYTELQEVSAGVRNISAEEAVTVVGSSRSSCCNAAKEDATAVGGLLLSSASSSDTPFEKSSMDMVSSTEHVKRRCCSVGWKRT